jgi:hypothetical protein
MSVILCINMAYKIFKGTFMKIKIENGSSNEPINRNIDKTEFNDPFDIDIQIIDLKPMVVESQGSTCCYTMHGCTRDYTQCCWR